MATKSAAGVKITPLSDRVVVKASEDTEQMRGGLYIPDTAKEKPQQGEIIAAGPGKYEDGKLVPVFNCNPPPELGQTCEPQAVPAQRFAQWRSGSHMTPRWRRQS